MTELGGGCCRCLPRLSASLCSTSRGVCSSIVLSNVFVARLRAPFQPTTTTTRTAGPAWLGCLSQFALTHGRRFRLRAWLSGRRGGVQRACWACVSVYAPFRGCPGAGVASAQMPEVETAVAEGFWGGTAVAVAVAGAGAVTSSHQQPSAAAPRHAYATLTPRSRHAGVTTDLMANSSFSLSLRPVDLHQVGTARRRATSQGERG